MIHKHLCLLLPLLLVGCAAPSPSPGLKSETNAPPEKRLDEPGRVIHRGDLVGITVRLPDRAFTSMEAVQPDGDVATPEGAFAKAEGLNLAAFRDSLETLYKKIPGYEPVRIEAWIASSPYAIIMPAPSSPGSATQGGAPPPPTIYRRIFKTPLTIWQAIQLEGGIPAQVDPRHIRILKADMKRRTLDCGGKEGRPEGGAALEAGDCIFLVPDAVPVSRIFD